jgi:hypothetical protein
VRAESLPLSMVFINSRAAVGIRKRASFCGPPYPGIAIHEPLVEVGRRHRIDRRPAWYSSTLVSGSCTSPCTARWMAPGIATIRRRHGAEFRRERLQGLCGRCPQD